VPLFWGTIYIGAIIAMIVAIPLGLMSAVFLTQYADPMLRRWVKPALEILAGVPTVVYGYFAALTVAPLIRDFAAMLGKQNPSTESALAAGLVMGVMIIPFVSSMADDSIAAVPQAMRDGSLAMGATQSETIKRVILPAALPGIVAGVEGGPGHQRSNPLGSYRRPETLIDRWDPIVAQVGGTWDTWLGKGLDVWGATADADFHHENGEYWPCEFSSTWLYAPDRSVDGVIRALHAGSYFGEHGHIVQKAELVATPAGQTRGAVPGQRLTVAAGTTVSVSMALDIPDTDFEGKANHVDVVELIGVAGGKSTVLFSDAPATPLAFNVPVNVPAGGIVLRARGRRTVDGGPALQFYTNPIRITTAR